MQKPNVQLLNEKEVADMTGIAVATLRNDRFNRRGFPYVKLGKSVRYKLEDVVAVIDKNTIRHDQ